MFAKFPNWIWRILFTASILLILFFHLISLDQVPKGLHIDEASIALNAASIAKNGVDEYGTKLPLYFKAFGEYKNPIYIYAAAGIFHFAGINVYNLKLTSSLFFLISLIPFYLIIKDLLKRPSSRLFALWSFGFLPQYFTTSRLAFEVISQLPFTLWSFWFTQKTYNDEKSNWKNLSLAFISGLFFGLTIYTYTTARLLEFLFIIAIFWIYRSKNYWGRHISLAIGALFSLIPWIWFFISDPNALTNRFDSGISFINANYLPVFSKGLVFIWQYLSYFSPQFLYSLGDPNPRHSIGFGGMVFMANTVLFFLGLFMVVKYKLGENRKFINLLILFTFLTPIAPALTWEGTPHALRSLLLGFFIVVWSGFGWEWLLNQKDNLKNFVSEVKTKSQNIKQVVLLPTILLITLGISLFWETSNYLFYYFTIYPDQSNSAFESSGFTSAMERAIRQKPSQVIVSNGAIRPYVHMEFAKYMIYNPNNVKIGIGDAKPQAESCLVYFPGDLNELNKYPDKYTDLSVKSEWMGVRCYE